jgi:glycosyltransferase involved in cell wall biosynthesis
MTSVNESVTFVVPDKMGGMMNIVANLLAYRQPDAFSYHCVFTHNHLSTDTRFAQRVAADTQRLVDYRLPVENLHTVIERLRRALPPQGGVLVTNDLLELAMASAVDLDRTVMMILHGDHDYYYDLAARHADVIDVFICYGRAMFDTLRRRLPDRADSILHLPYGIPLPSRTRAQVAGALRLLFAGRLEHGQKGVFDLPGIDAALKRAGVPVNWTMVGAGPDEAALRERWGVQPHVQWLGAQPNARVLEIAAEHDVFVLPTRAEGFPVALLEAMAVGLVPVVSDLASGVRELVRDGVHGLLRGIGDITGFAEAIGALHRDRARVEAMSRAARERVVSDYDVTVRVRDYQDLFARHRELRRPRAENVTLPYGSRLDQPWIPNVAVKAVRSVVRRAAGKPV